jgi:hypothetical protein
VKGKSGGVEHERCRYTLSEELLETCKEYGLLILNLGTQVKRSGVTPSA